MNAIERAEEIVCVDSFPDWNKARDALRDLLVEYDLQREKVLSLIIERDQWKMQAEQKMALRREVEEILGIESAAAGDEQFMRGVERLRSIKAENENLHKYIADMNAGQLEAERKWAEECERLKTQLAGRTYCHSDERVEADVRVMAEAIKEHHLRSCHWCPTGDGGSCHDYHSTDRQKFCCACPACEMARKYIKEPAYERV